MTDQWYISLLSRLIASVEEHFLNPSAEASMDKLFQPGELSRQLDQLSFDKSTPAEIIARLGKLQFGPEDNPTAMLDALRACHEKTRDVRLSHLASYIQQTIHISKKIKDFVSEEDDMPLMAFSGFLELWWEQEKIDWNMTASIWAEIHPFSSAVVEEQFEDVLSRLNKLGVDTLALRKIGFQALNQHGHTSIHISDFNPSNEIEWWFLTAIHRIAREFPRGDIRVSTIPEDNTFKLTVLDNISLMYGIYYFFNQGELSQLQCNIQHTFGFKDCSFVVSRPHLENLAIQQDKYVQVVGWLKDQGFTIQSFYIKEFSALTHAPLFPSEMLVFFPGYLNKGKGIKTTVAYPFVAVVKMSTPKLALKFNALHTQENSPLDLHLPAPLQVGAEFALSSEHAIKLWENFVCKSTTVAEGSLAAGQGLFAPKGSALLEQVTPEPGPDSSSSLPVTVAKLS